MRLKLIILAVLALATVAFAQDFSWSPIEWGNNPAIAALALAGAIAWLRNTRFGQRLDGPVPVGAVTVIVGSAAGAGIQLAGLLAVEPYASMGAPIGGIAYGVSLAVFNITGIAIWNYLTSKVRPVNLTVPVVTGDTLALTNTSSNPITEFIIAFAKQAVGAVKLPAALNAVLPLLKQFAQSEAILTDDLRSNLQGQVLSLLRKAGLVGVDL